MDEQGAWNPSFDRLRTNGGYTIDTINPFVLSEVEARAAGAVVRG